MLGGIINAAEQAKKSTDINVWARNASYIRRTAQMFHEAIVARPDIVVEQEDDGEI